MDYRERLIDDSESPIDIEKLPLLVRDLLVAMNGIDFHMSSEQIEFPANPHLDPPLYFRVLFLNYDRMANVINPLLGDLESVHTATNPEINGKGVWSHTESLLNAFDDRLEWMRVQITRSTAVSPRERAEEDAAAVFKELDILRTTWKFEPMDPKDWKTKVNWELKRLESAAEGRERRPPGKPGSVPDVRIQLRNDRIRVLARKHKLVNQWKKLADIANGDPEIKALGLSQKITRDIARNAIHPPKTRAKTRGSN
jgi:hypothetical protein